MPKQILVIDGHPDPGSFTASIAEAYAQGARAAGHEVHLLHLGELAFDPVLHSGFRSKQPLEPDLVAAQAAIQRADHVVLAFPLWWGGLPALLKGFFDRTLLPGFAFRYRAGHRGWDKLLTGKTARLLLLTDTPSWVYRWIYRSPATRQLRLQILGFCGIKLVGSTHFAPVVHADGVRRAAWLSAAKRLGAEGQ